MKARIVMERIKQIWQILDKTDSNKYGLFKLRYSDVSNCDVFLGIKYPENYNMLMIKVPITIGKDFSFRYEFRGLKFEKIFDPDDSNYLLLNLVLVEKQFQDIYDSLISDIITAIINESEINIILKNFSNRLIKWQSLFERLKNQGLTPEEQRGLYGELFFLRSFLNSNINTIYVIDSWVGCKKEIRDFQLNDWAVEVKTTQSNNHQKVIISSERQLDTKNIRHLFLNHLSLEATHKNGETLIDIIKEILCLLIDNEIALKQFKFKLLEAGYFEHHKYIYEDTGYYVRKNQFFKVENEFPRIEESEIRDGVGDIKYSIILSLCDNYLVNKEIVLKILTEVMNNGNK
jgi:hypothetical protein